MNFPDDSLQSLVASSAWWQETDSQSVDRGFLIKAFIPHVDQTPNTIEPVGRQEANIHSKAIVKIRPLDIKAPRKREDLPVAAMTLYQKEVWTAYRAKLRPCLVLGKNRNMVEKSVRKGQPQKNTAPTLLVAPYYGIDRDGSRAGYNPEFIERVRHIKYPQFFWDQLPIGGPKESLLRFDHLQAIGFHYSSLQKTGYKLCKEALEILDEVFNLHLFDRISEESELLDFLKLVEDYFYSGS
ncbi:MAG: hypothetical protein MI862_05465 [Desulfobacterales bacterium]|nr:hypothetical protein [Desulfobacterales bacterium]